MSSRVGMSMMNGIKSPITFKGHPYQVGILPRNNVKMEYTRIPIDGGILHKPHKLNILA